MGVASRRGVAWCGVVVWCTVKLKLVVVVRVVWWWCGVQQHIIVAFAFAFGLFCSFLLHHLIHCSIRRNRTET